MILCARSTLRSREQSTKRRSRSENTRKFVYSIVKVRLYDYQTWRAIHEVRKGLWAFFLHCAFRILIGWAGKRDHVGITPLFTVGEQYIFLFFYLLSLLRIVAFPFFDERCGT